MTNTDSVLGYRRPAMLGGAASADPDALTIRWYGTSNYELNFRDRVILLDTFYDRGPRMRGLGFAPDEVTRADAVLIGHPHYDHMSDAAQVAKQTGAPVVIHPLGADVLTRGGLDTSKIMSVTGRGEGDVLEFPEFTLRVIHGFHAELGHPELQAGLQALVEARRVWERDMPPVTDEEEAHAAAVRERGSMAPEVFTEGTMCLVIDVDGYRIVYRDSGGPVSEEERAFFSANPGCDLAMVGFIGRPLVRRLPQHRQNLRPTGRLRAHPRAPFPLFCHPFVLPSGPVRKVWRPDGLDTTGMTPDGMRLWVCALPH